MAQITIRDFLVHLGVDFDEASAKKAQFQVERLKKNADILANSFETMKKIATRAFVAIGAAGAAAAIFGKQSIEAANEVDLWRKRVGGTVEELSALKFAAEASGIEGEKAFEGIVEIGEKASDIVRNIKKLTGDAGESFKALGFTSFKQLQKPNGQLRDGIDLFDDVIGRLSKVKVDVDRTGIAMRLFGDDVGQAFAGIDIAQLNLLRSEAVRLGITMSEDNVQASRAFSTSASTLTNILGALRNKLVFGVLPGVTEVVDKMNQWLFANGKIIRSKIDKYAKKLTSIFQTGAFKISRYISFVVSLEKKTGFLKYGFIALASAASFFFLRTIGATAVSAMTTLIGLFTKANAVAFLASVPYVVLGGLIVALGLLIEDLIVHWEDGEFAIDRMLKKFREPISLSDSSFVQLIKALIKLLDGLGDTINDVINLFDNGLAKSAKRALRDRAFRIGSTILLRDEEQVKKDLQAFRTSDQFKDQKSQEIIAKRGIDRTFERNERVKFLTESLNAQGSSKIINQNNAINIDIKGTVSPETTFDLTDRMKQGLNAVTREIE